MLMEKYVIAFDEINVIPDVCRIYMEANTKKMQVKVL